MKCETGGHPGQKEISGKGDEKRQINRAGAELGRDASLGCVPALSGAMASGVRLPTGTPHAWTALSQRHRWFLSFLFTGCLERISKTKKLQ